MMNSSSLIAQPASPSQIPPKQPLQEIKGTAQLDQCLPLNKCVALHAASDAAVQKGKAVTVLTYLHGVKEAQIALQAIQVRQHVVGWLDVALLTTGSRRVHTIAHTHTNELAPTGA